MTTILDEVDLLRMIAEGEGQKQEFKRLIDNQESVAGEIVAFANSDGGVLYIGVEDDGSIVGVADPDVVFQTLTNLCRDRCIPPVSPIIEQLVLAGRTVLALTVKPALNRLKPYRTAGGR
ncbi:MAG: ATP-binding protein, partial [Anaerolineae bacterium]